MADGMLVYEGVSKKLGGKEVLKQINLSISEGEIVGIVGANGSGKTTLLRLATGLIYPDQGEIRVAGKPVRPGLLGDLPVSLGVLIESPSFLPYLSGLKNLLLLASIRDQVNESKVRESIQRVGLDPDLRKPVKTYSLGMRQRLGIAQAMMEDPAIYLFDEPTNGLDHQGVEMFSEILTERTDQGACVVLVSHDQEEINRFCDRVYRMESGSLESVREKRVKGWRLLVESLEDVEKTLLLISGSQMSERKNGLPTVICKGTWKDEVELRYYLDQHGIQPVEIQVNAS